MEAMLAEEKVAAVAAGVRFIEKERPIVIARVIRRLKAEDDVEEPKHNIACPTAAVSGTKAMQTTNDEEVVANRIGDQFKSRGKENLLTRYINDLKRALANDGNKERGDVTTKCGARDDDEDEATVDSSLMDLSESEAGTSLSDSDNFDVEVIEEEVIPAEESSMLPHWPRLNEEVCLQSNEADDDGKTTHNEEADNSNNYSSNGSNDEKKPELERRTSLLQNIVEDFNPNKGDQKILRAIGRTATVNAAVLVTAATGGAAGAVGFATGGAITGKRMFDGLAKQDEKEITKSLAVYGCATGASVAGQAITGALMIGVVGASLPLAGAVAFGVGCVSGISAGALSEFTVDSVMDKMKSMRKRGVRRRRKSTDGRMERSESDGALLLNAGRHDAYQDTLLSRNFDSLAKQEEVEESMRRSQSCRF
uniref:Uncharacterized protein n=1 Tax=Odontella aurita TaxID=265563 RepID=A0A7S4J387_9STRA|mmetsp:Transcript_36925/g.110610  ORF Transcript_36925/g.110610 Transcript_36925/m.110610 type:complete len:423 (+) Transcript_36925:83-1351(+)